MSNPEHLAKLKEGVESWNIWRRASPQLIPDLSSARLSKAQLSGFNLSRANLSHADMYRADLNESALFKADLHNANLSEAKLQHANMNRVSMRDAKLFRADMRWVYLRKAYLFQVELSGADLSDARLFGADLRRANLTKATLERTDLRAANLQSANFDRATLTDSYLWETLRADWSIKAVICERAFWDRDSNEPIEYAVGEFERLYSDQTTIELFYKGGISLFEINTLPALLQHLASRHPNTNIRLKTIEQTGGGAKITISLGDADEHTKKQMEEDALQVVKAQLALRDNENLRLQIQNDLLREQHRETIHFMLSTGGTHFHAPVQNAMLSSDKSQIKLQQTFNDNVQLIELIENILSHNTELTATQSAEIEAAKTELQRTNPDKFLLTRTLGFLKTLPKEAVLKGVGKLGERAAEADWSNLLHQLGELIHHLR